MYQTYLLQAGAWAHPGRPGWPRASAPAAGPERARTRRQTAPFQPSPNARPGDLRLTTSGIAARCRVLLRTLAGRLCPTQLYVSLRLLSPRLSWTLFKTSLHLQPPSSLRLKLAILRDLEWPSSG
ncbi:uncharacterized protein LOC144334117 [Macaca mulatta]